MTTPQVADLVRNVAGGRMEVRQLLPSGADPHGYEPRPSDARAIREAPIVFRSGGEIDGWLEGLIDSAARGGETVSLIEQVRPLERDGRPDPHWWHDPRNALAAVEAIRAGLARVDQAGRPAYARNAAVYSAELRRLDRRIADCIARIPSGRRRLVTTHGSLGYFARRYRLEAVGALIPALSTQAQASAGETERLVREIERTGIPAIFPEHGLTPRLEKAVARESGARLGEPLFTDTLGPVGSREATYVGAMAANAAAIADGLGGTKRSCPPGT